MKKTFLLSLLCCIFLSAHLSAQEVELTTFAAPGGKFGDYSAWQTVVDPSHPDIKVAYRISLDKRKGMGSHYLLQLKNEGADKVKGKVYFAYTTIFIPTLNAEKFKFSIAPGATEEVRMIVQGCKRQSKSDIGDEYAIASGCPFRYSVDFK